MHRLARWLLLMAAALGSIFLSGCPKEEREEDPYPIWILSVEVLERSEDGSSTPVQGCPRLVWRYSTDQGDPNRVSCIDGGNTTRHQEHIDDVVTVVYYIECDGYFPSEARARTFDPAQAVQRPGRPGAEVTFYDRVSLMRE